LLVILLIILVQKLLSKYKNYLILKNKSFKFLQISYMFELALATQLETGFNPSKLENIETENNRIELVTEDRNNTEFQDSLKALKFEEANNKVETGLEGYTSIPSLKLQETLLAQRIPMVAQCTMQHRRTKGHPCSRAKSLGRILPDELVKWCQDNVFTNASAERVADSYVKCEGGVVLGAGSQSYERGNNQTYHLDKVCNSLNPGQNAFWHPTSQVCAKSRESFYFYPKK
jgi:hypothetical protein